MENTLDSVEVKIVGTAPMLMHRYSWEEEEQGKQLKRKDRQFDPKEDAEKALYKNKEGQIYIPALWIEACLRDAGKEVKTKGNATLKKTVQQSVFIEPEEILLGKKTYDQIDRRPVNVDKKRIVRSRPLFNPGWSATFVIKFHPKKIASNTLKELLESAGAFQGVGTYRPKFGRFKVETFERSK